MKFKINATEYAAITDEATKAMYKQVGDDYVMQIDGMPDFAAMEQKNAELLNELKQGKAKNSEREKAEKQARDELARKNGDVEALEASYKQQLADQAAQFDAERQGLTGSLNKLLVGNVANQLALELGGEANAKLWMPHILPRLSVELVGEQHVTRVLDANGKPSALDVAGLTKELGGDKTFAAILKGPGSQGTPTDPNPNPGTPNPNSRQAVDPMFNAALSAIKNMGDNGAPSV